jgi:hypothetical protein
MAISNEDIRELCEDLDKFASGIEASAGGPPGEVLLEMTAADIAEIAAFVCQMAAAAGFNIPDFATDAGPGGYQDGTVPDATTTGSSGTSGSSETGGGGAGSSETSLQSSQANPAETAETSNTSETGVDVSDHSETSTGLQDVGPGSGGRSEISDTDTGGSDTGGSDTGGGTSSSETSGGSGSSETSGGSSNETSSETGGGSGSSETSGGDAGGGGGGDGGGSSSHTLMNTHPEAGDTVETGGQEIAETGHSAEIGPPLESGPDV